MPKLGEKLSRLSSDEDFIYDGTAWHNADLSFYANDPAMFAKMAFLKYIHLGTAEAVRMGYQERIQNHPLRRKVQAFNNWTTEWMLAGPRRLDKRDTVTVTRPK